MSKYVNVNIDFEMVYYALNMAKTQLRNVNLQLLGNDLPGAKQVIENNNRRINRILKAEQDILAVASEFIVLNDLALAASDLNSTFQQMVYDYLVEENNIPFINQTLDEFAEAIDAYRKLRKSQFDKTKGAKALKNV